MPLWVISCSKLLLWGDDLLLRPDVDEQLQLREEKLLIVESGQLKLADCDLHISPHQFLMGKVFLPLGDESNQVL
jgi:hypothetical protein